LAGGLGPGEPGGLLGPAAAELGGQGLIDKAGQDGPGHALRVFGVKGKAGITHDLGQRAGVGGDQRRATGQGFQDWEAKALIA
jgi:hypothetical protein